ncbi:MAG: LOG family protein [Candidatus Nanoarchaeia archaeon]
MFKRGIKEELEKNEFRVAIFGSARIGEKRPRYIEVERLAKKLGEMGVDIVTGGGPGLMEAASKGFKEGIKKSKNKKVHSIGLGIKLPREQRFNKHLDVEKEFHIFSNRLDSFMLLSNAIVVGPGGVGTILELFYAWQLVQVQHICNIPIILFGKQWPPLVNWLKKWPLKNGMISKKDFEHIFVARTQKDVLEIIEKTHEAYSKGDKNFCLNYKKYKIK